MSDYAWLSGRLWYDFVCETGTEPGSFGTNQLTTERKCDRMIPSEQEIIEHIRSEYFKYVMKCSERKSPLISAEASNYDAFLSGFSAGVVFLRDFLDKNRGD